LIVAKYDWGITRSDDGYFVEGYFVEDYFVEDYFVEDYCAGWVNKNGRRGYLRPFANDLE
jgi:hypothetical protein